MKNKLLVKNLNIRSTLLCLVLIIIATYANASIANYYPVSGNTDLSQIGQWTPNSDGSAGTAPANFTAAGQVFNITNTGNANPTIAANWTVSGTGSSIVIGDGVNSVNFSIPAAYKVTGSISAIKASATIMVSNLAGITWPASADPASTIDFLNLGNSNAIPVSITYGNVIFDGTKFVNTGTNTFIVAGNFTLQNSGAGFYPGNTGVTKTSINLTGSNNQILTGNGLTFDCYNFSDTTKTGGSVTFATNTPVTFNNSLWLKQTGVSNLFSDGGNTFTSLNNLNLFGVAAGYNLTGTIILAGASGTQKITNNNNYTVPGPPVAALNNVTISTSGTGKISFITNTLASVVTIKGNLINNSTSTGVPAVTLNSISPTVGIDTFNIQGNFINTQTTSVKYNSGTVYTFCGTGTQLLQTAAAADTITNLSINNASGVALNSPFALSGNFNLSNGLLNTSATNILKLIAGASTTGGSLTSYVKGPMIKVGNTVFTFPVGGNGRFAPIGISAPASITNAITASYTFIACSAGKPSLNTPLENISTGEFWNLAQTLTDAISVTLFWENSDSSRINTFDNTLVVADSTGSSWNSEGQSAITPGSLGNVTSNAITIPTTGEQITFGSTNASSNPLLTPLLASTVINDFNCSGNNTGNVTADVSGGNGSYTYSWNSNPVQTGNIATGLPAGSYTVNVMDGNSCSATATIAINTGLAPNASVTATNSCNGQSNGSVMASVTGGTGSYTYSWNTTPVQTTATASGLPAGSYTVTIMDGNSCSATATVTLTDPAKVTANINTSADPKCNGNSNGTALVTAGGGTSTYTYSWNSTPVQTNALATGLPAGSYSVTVMDGNSCAATANVTLTDPDKVTANINTSADPKCNGNSDGSAIVTAGGGTSAYTYSWNSTPVQTNAQATGLPAGSYTVTVMDGNLCTATANITLTDPPVLTADSGLSTNATCVVTGTAAVVAGGGTGAYTYLWSNNATTSSINNLASGSYSVTITDANLCTATINIRLTNPAGVNASITPSVNPTCNASSDGSASVVGSGGTGTYTYLWSNNATASSISAVPAGSYSVTVTDGNQCVGTANITLTAPGVVTANITGSADPKCNGSSDGSATVLAGGGTPSYTYSWNSNPVQTNATATNLSAGSYTVTVTDANSCPAGTATVTLVNPAVVSVGTDTIHNASCNGCLDGGAGVIISGGHKNVIVWEDSTLTGYVVLTNHVSDTATKLAAGTYVCVATDSCGDTKTDTVRITSPGPTGIQSINMVDGVTIYPLPNNGHFAISFKGEGYQLLDIYDETGKEIYSQILNDVEANRTISVDLGIYANGIYFAHIITTQGYINKKIVIQK
ncbi:MAG TPA: T9SS type A sorting domain-containing protein [Bacteroidia bacterium]|nr:T9SS type A sorting domain-containing protein [Bacteroidia bacterium]